MSYRDFEYAFLHRFGPHGGETPEEILARKQKEINSNGWTLWSFQYRRMFEEWYSRLSSQKKPDVYVFCSWSKDSKDPAANEENKTLNCKRYREIGTAQWSPVPKGVQCSYSFKIGNNSIVRLPSAFIVQRICRLDDEFALNVQWLRRDEKWMASGKSREYPPTRGEYLIRRTQSGALFRKIRVILELKHPYLARLRPT